MYDQSKLSELIRFARVDAGSTVMDFYPGDGEWTRLFSDVVGAEGRVYSFGLVLASILKRGVLKEHRFSRCRSSRR